MQPDPIVGVLPHPLHPLSVVPRAKPPAVLGQKLCKAISTPVWLSGTGVTPEGCSERGPELPAALFYCRDRVCSQRGRITFWGEPAPGQPLRRAGFTSVIWVTDKVTFGLCLCVTAGFLRSSAASVAAGFRILPSGAEPEPLSLSPRDARSSLRRRPQRPPRAPHGTLGCLGCPRQGGCSGQAPRSPGEGFGFPFSLAGRPGGSSFNTKKLLLSKLKP